MNRYWRLMGVMVVAVGLAACAVTPPSAVDEAKAALAGKDAAKAVTVLEKAVAAEPSNAAAHILLGQAYLRVERKADAEQQFSAGFTLDPAAALTADATAEEHFLAGNVHAALGQFDQALSAYETTLKLDPAKAGALTNIGVVYYQTGKLDDAIGQFKRALELDAQDAETHYLLGAAYVQQEKLAEAEAEFNTALGLKPELAPAHIGLGNIYLLGQQYDQAIASLEKALAIQADSPEALFAIGQAYAAAGQTAQAIDALTKCVALNPPEPFRSKAQEILQQLNAAK